MTIQSELYSNNSTNVRFDTTSYRLKRLSINTMGLLFPKQTKSKIKQLFFKPARKRPTVNEQKVIDRAYNFQIQVHGNTIQCWQWGEGPKILAVHGWNGAGTNLHPFIQPLLEKGLAVVSFDAPAHGQSEGEMTNYFEITDTVRAMVKHIGRNNLAGIVAHSIGAAAAINCLSKENLHTKTALIAPALKLQELLFNTFEKNGVPRHMYIPIITELEKEFGYSIKEDNPYKLLENLNSEVMIVHDHGDRMVPFDDACTIAGKNNMINFQPTNGLGHKRILKDKNTIEKISQYLTGFIHEMEFQQTRESLITAH